MIELFLFIVVGIPVAIVLAMWIAVAAAAPIWVPQGCAKRLSRLMASGWASPLRSELRAPRHP
jgi:hypothetical protein